MDNDEVTRLVYVDFRKAFEVIDHNLLLKKFQKVELEEIIRKSEEIIRNFQNDLDFWGILVLISRKAT